MVKIITDSAADIPKEQLEKLPIRIMNIPITIDGKTYREGKDFEIVEYYDMLKNAKSLPTHAQITMMEFTDAFIEEIKNGAKNIIVITISSKGSGIHDAAVLAKQNLFEDEKTLTEGITIDIIDGRGYSYYYGFAAVQAAKAAEEGKSREEILDIIQSCIDGYGVYLGLNELSYAKKSGRITAVAAFVGEVMGFKPILTFKDGSIVTVTKVRGDKKLIEEMADRAANEMADDGRPYFVVTADNMPAAEELKKAIQKRTKIKCSGIFRTGASVTTNAGPTVTAVVYPKKQW